LGEWLLKAGREEGQTIKEARIKLKIYIAQWKIILKKIILEYYGFKSI